MIYRPSGYMAKASGAETAGGRSSSQHRALILRNRQRVRSLNMRLLRQIAQRLLEHAWPREGVDLAVYVVNQAEITHLNEKFLRHKGSTDVITFDYSGSVAADVSRRTPSEVKTAPTDVGGYLLHGEIFVCIEEALTQARSFRTTWQSELVRYIVHGVLHLLNYDDQDVRSRHRMKAAENALVCRLATEFSFRRLTAPRNGAQ
jgi:probable rRNA maturation factor